jgi:DNA repair photolyase
MQQQVIHGSYHRRSILNPSGVNWPDHTGSYPRLYNCNIGLGCTHGCTYCYAPLVLKRKRSTWKNWIKVENAVELLRTEVHKPAGRVMFSSTTEPYLEPKMARQVLKLLLSSHHYVLVITKRPDVVNDLDILRGRKNVEIGFSITGLDDSAVQEWEPDAPAVSERIRAAKTLHDAGVKTYASIEPWIPNVTHPFEIIQKFDSIFDRWIIGALNYMHEDHRQYLPELKETVMWLEENKKPYYLKKELRRLLS